MLPQQKWRETEVYNSNVHNATLSHQKFPVQQSILPPNPKQRQFALLSVLILLLWSGQLSQVSIVAAQFLSFNFNELFLTSKSCGRPIRCNISRTLRNLEKKKHKYYLYNYSSYYHSTEQLSATSCWRKTFFIQI